MAAPHVVVVGAGFAGLAAAYELSRGGARVTVLEHEADVGGLAGGFRIDGHRVEKFYHHWFTSDRHVTRLIAELGLGDQVVVRPTRTGMYLAQRHWSLSTPLDLLRFSPLSPWGRLRLGLLALRARAVRDWRALDDVSAEDWLKAQGGPEVYRIVWEPLLRGKFGAHAARVSAVWFWSKLVLRGGSRRRGGRETLMYFRGGFAALADRVADAVRQAGGAIRLGAEATGLVVLRGAVTGVRCADGTSVDADAVVLTAALPVVADLVAPHVPSEYVRSLRSIDYLGNVCLVLGLDRSLSSTYWLNVNDPGFPFVGLIEHTNLDTPDAYGGQHVVYLSRYMPTDDPLYRMPDDAWLDFALPHLRRMFPEFDRAWVRSHRVWRAPYAQPVMVCGYGRLVPPVRTPLARLFLCTMAQIYPEDRGTNYAIRDGRATAAMLLEDLRVGLAGSPGAPA